MNQEQFIRLHEQEWQQLETWLDAKKTNRKKDAEQHATLGIDYPYLYRRVCHHLALARSRLYSQQIIERLNRLVLRAHQQFYRRKSGLREKVFDFIAAGFPALVRKEWRLLSVSSLLFYGPLLVMLIATQLYPDMIYTVMDADQVRSMEQMYDPNLQERYGREREADSDFMMFGFYIRNNTGIGFRTFAGGLLFGTITIITLLFNGLYIGAIAGHLTSIGSGTPFWSFVSGHSAMELTAIALSGAAGLKLAIALIRPGRNSRMLSLIEAGRDAVRIIYGAALMFLIAAFIEAFWSSIAWLPPTTKYTVGIGLWLVVIAYFAIAGRGRAT